MKNIKAAILTTLILLPLTAFADAEEVLIPIFGQIFEIIILFVIILFVKLKAAQKVILSISFFLSICISWVGTDNMPFRENFGEITFIMLALPFIVVVSIFILIKMFARS